MTIDRLKKIKYKVWAIAAWLILLIGMPGLVQDTFAAHAVTQKTASLKTANYSGNPVEFSNSSVPQTSKAGQSITQRPHPSDTVESDTAVQDTASSRLNMYLQEAARNNPGLRADFYEYRALLGQAPQAGALPDPEVMFMYWINPENSISPLKRMTLSATQRFPWFGTLKTAEKRVKKLAESKLMTFIDNRNKLFRDIKKTWFRIYEMKHHEMILKQNMDLLGQLESRAMARYETGKGSQVEVLRLQMEVDRVETRIKQMQHHLDPLYADFNALLNRESGTQIRLDKPMADYSLSLSPEELIAKIEKQNAGLVSFERREEAARRNLELARLNGLPSFGLGIEAMAPNYMFMSMMSGNRTALSAKLSIKVPLYRDRFKAQRQEAKMNIRSVEERQVDLRNRLQSRLQSVLQQYRDAQYRIELYRDRLIPKTRQALDIELQGYSAETADFESLITLQQQLLDYEMGLNTAFVERNIAIADIEVLYGRYNIDPEEISYND